MDEYNDVEKQPSVGPATEELSALSAILAALTKLTPESRSRVFQTVATFFGLQTPVFGSGSIFTSSARATTDAPTSQRANESSFSEDRSLSAKQFLFEKQPKSDVERVACLAYYLTHYMNVNHFKTLDISKLNTEAAQIKFANPSASVENATKTNYLVPAAKGTKQISALGEQFVLALPDRDKAREIMKSVRPRRRARKNGQESDEQGEA